MLLLYLFYFKTKFYRILVIFTLFKTVILNIRLFKWLFNKYPLNFFKKLVFRYGY